MDLVPFISCQFACVQIYKIKAECQCYDSFIANPHFLSAYFIQSILQRPQKIPQAINMSFDTSDLALTYTLPFQLTKKIHRAVPDNLQPGNPDLNARGKIVVITGGGSGIGAVSLPV